MRGILRMLLVNAVVLYFVALLFPGLHINPTIETYIVVTLIFTIISGLLGPVIGIVALPLNILTLGLFSSVITLITLFILTKLSIGIKVTSFTFPGIQIFGFVLEPFTASGILSYVLISVIIFFTVRFTNWILES